MPGFDGTGPRGLGSMTGRKIGKCNDGQNNFRGRGRGQGRGLGRCLYFNQAISSQEKLNVLKQQKEELNREIELLEKALN